MNVLMREAARRAADWPPLAPAVVNPDAATAPALLGKAAQIMSERAKTYDQPGGERSMGKTVAAFNAITGRNLTEAEGWLLQAVLKMVRGQSKPEPHRDSADDLVAYSSLYGEARLAGR